MLEALEYLGRGVCMDALELRLTELKAFWDKSKTLNHFELLAVSEDADANAVRAAYFALLKKYGVDFFHAVSDADDKACIEALNQRLRQAYDTLSHPEKRERYLAQSQGKALPEQGSAALTEGRIDIAAVFEAEQSLNQARLLIEHSEYEVALVKLEKAASLDPSSPEIAAHRAYARYMLLSPQAGTLKRVPEAVQVQRKALEAAAQELPKAAYVRLYLGDLESIEENTSLALIHYREAVKIEPSNASALRAIKLMQDRQREAQQPKREEGLWAKVRQFLNKKI